MAILLSRTPCGEIRSGAPGLRGGRAQGWTPAHGLVKINLSACAACPGPSQLYATVTDGGGMLAAALLPPCYHGIGTIPHTRRTCGDRSILKLFGVLPRCALRGGTADGRARGESRRS